MARKPTVLFVDADKMARTIFDFRARLSDIPHFIAESAEAAVTVLEEHPVDIVVTDLFLPGHDGVELIRCMRETDYTKNIPIIVFTVGGNPQKLADAMSAGATETMMKQITPIEKVLERVCVLTHETLAREDAFTPLAPSGAS